MAPATSPNDAREGRQHLYREADLGSEARSGGRYAHTRADELPPGSPPTNYATGTTTALAPTLDRRSAAGAGARVFGE